MHEVEAVVLEDILVNPVVIVFVAATLDNQKATVGMEVEWLDT